MEVAYRDSFSTQCKRFAFCFTCEHCAHFDEHEQSCVHGFPNEIHLLKTYQAEPKPRSILFCKEFDLA